MTRSGPGPSSGAPSTPGPSVSASQPVGVALTEWFVFIPRDRKCPKFNGRSDIRVC